MNTNKRLIRLMKKHSLSLQAVAELLYVTVDSVKGWRVREDSTRWTAMPRNLLELLEIKLGEKDGKQNKKA